MATGTVVQEEMLTNTLDEKKGVVQGTSLLVDVARADDYNSLKYAKDAEGNQPLKDGHFDYTLSNIVGGVLLEVATGKADLEAGKLTVDRLRVEDTPDRKEDLVKFNIEVDGIEKSLVVPMNNLDVNAAKKLVFEKEYPASEYLESPERIKDTFDGLDASALTDMKEKLRKELIESRIIKSDVGVKAIDFINPAVLFDEQKPRDVSDLPEALAERAQQKIAYMQREVMVIEPSIEDTLNQQLAEARNVAAPVKRVDKEAKIEEAKEANREEYVAPVLRGDKPTIDVEAVKPEQKQQGLEALAGVNPEDYATPAPVKKAHKEPVELSILKDNSAPAVEAKVAEVPVEAVAAPALKDRPILPTAKAEAEVKPVTEAVVEPVVAEKPVPELRKPTPYAEVESKQEQKTEQLAESRAKAVESMNEERQKWKESEANQVAHEKENWKLKDVNVKDMQGEPYLSGKTAQQFDKVIGSALDSSNSDVAEVSKGVKDLGKKMQIGG